MIQTNTDKLLTLIRIRCLLNVCVSLEDNYSSLNTMSCRIEIFPTLFFLECQEDIEADKLNRILNSRFDLEDLHFSKSALIRKVKQVHANYEDVSGRLVDRYLDLALIAKAEEVRISRRRLRLDVHNFVRNIGAFMSQGDDISRVNLESVKSKLVQNLIEASARDSLPPTGSVPEQIMNVPDPTGEITGRTLYLGGNRRRVRDTCIAHNIDTSGTTDCATLYYGGNHNSLVTGKITVSEHQSGGVVKSGDSDRSHDHCAGRNCTQNRNVQQPSNGFVHNLRLPVSIRIQNSLINVLNEPALPALLSSPEDLDSITPAQLLALEDYSNPPVLKNFTEKTHNQCGRRRWGEVQVLADEFWHKWRAKYVSSLQERRKWTHLKKRIRPDVFTLYSIISSGDSYRRGGSVTFVKPHQANTI